MTDAIAAGIYPVALRKDVPCDITPEQWIVIAQKQDTFIKEIQEKAIEVFGEPFEVHDSIGEFVGEGEDRKWVVQPNRMEYWLSCVGKDALDKDMQRVIIPMEQRGLFHIAKFSPTKEPTQKQADAILSLMENQLNSSLKNIQP